MMTIRRLSIGAGYKYLLKSIAVGDGPEATDKSDLVRYYSETGTPPGVFLGAGLVGLNNGLGVAAGQSVSAENLQRMLQECADPITGEVLGRNPNTRAVGGFDLTFSPAKSVSVAWALADHETRDVIYRCHRAAIEEVLTYAEREVFRTRIGKQGCVEKDIVGVVAASFTHFDSRDGDPQLHDHVVILNRAQDKDDGAWRTLDSRGLFASAVTLSEMHQGLLSDLLTAELGWGWEAHSRRSSSAPKWEVAGVSKRLMDEFSQRTTAIVAEKDRLIAQFENDHHRAPTDVEVLKLRQTATLSTRRAKKSHGLGGLIEEWTTRATPYLDDEPAAWVHELGDRDVPAFTSDDFEDEILLDVANSTLDVVSAKRPTFRPRSFARCRASVSPSPWSGFSLPLGPPTWLSPRHCSSRLPTCTTRRVSCFGLTAPPSSREPVTGSTHQRHCSTPKHACSTRASASMPQPSAAPQWLK
jgi:conjugative relaxase-like TrwC/TraI family protein